MSASMRSPSTSRSSATSVAGAESVGFRVGSKLACVRTEHSSADIHSDPLVSLLCEDFSAEAASGSDVKEVTRPRPDVLLVLLLVVAVFVVLHPGGLWQFGGGEVEQFEAAEGHFGLDRLHARVARVLGRLARIVELRKQSV